MRRILLFSIVLLTVAFVACKKNETRLPTDMRVKVNEDTAFVTTDVKTDNDNSGKIFINGKSTDGKQRIQLTLSGYTGAKKTFDIDYRGLGGNILGSSAQYTRDANLYVASSGKITINSVAEGVINGTFYFFSNQTTVSGSFVAPAH